VTSSLHRGSRRPIRIADCGGEAIKLGKTGRGTCRLDVVGRYARPDASRNSGRPATEAYTHIQVTAACGACQEVGFRGRTGR
jgi:hypothetical protein